MVDKYRQTDLPQDVTRPLQEKPIFSTGFSRTSNVPLRARKPRNTRYVEEVAQQYRMKSSTVFVGTTVLTILAASESRRYLLLQNQSPVDILIGFGTTPSLTQGIGVLLLAGTQLSFENKVVPNNDIEAVSPAQSRLAIIEGSIA